MLVCENYAVKSGIYPPVFTWRRKKKRQGEFNIQAKNNILSFVTDKHFIMR